MIRIVADSMVLIHLAKLTILEALTGYLHVIIPGKVYREVTANAGKFPDAMITKALIEKNKIEVVNASETIVKELERFGIVKGEAEAAALLKEGKGDVIASDDDIIRKNSMLLDLKVAGTPTLIMWLFKKKEISKFKAIESLTELKKIGWFEAGLIDRIIAGVERHE